MNFLHRQTEASTIPARGCATARDEHVRRDARSVEIMRWARQGGMRLERPGVSLMTANLSMVSQASRVVDDATPAAADHLRGEQCGEKNKAPCC